MITPIEITRAKLKIKFRKIVRYLDNISWILTKLIAITSEAPSISLSIELKLSEIDLH